MTANSEEEPKDIYQYLKRISDRKDRNRWTSILAELRGRNLLISHVHKTRREAGKGSFPLLANFELSSTDVFVEKALYHLEERAKSYQRWAMSMLALAGIAVVGAVLQYTKFDPITFDIQNAVKWNYIGLVMFVLRSATLAALFGYTIYIFVSFARAFFHEATILRNRSHSLRFGRLYIYLKFGGIETPSELTQARTALDVDDLEEAFGWNIDSTTAFKEIKAELAMEGPYGKAFELVQKGIEIGAEAIKPGSGRLPTPEK